ncbi:secreted trypsin-like serine protease [Crossiella equi]|uniref:Secreted trypsin-like serine protease n=1 Tax=Crossiella equi TaxID=130796 RepID=A0ABS5APP9_9PSEU|nr:trypsin-like serine protease [Crossiella equi]MBP2478520.1 secreted trypsin-like serine protease [Crossiella equi]
MSPLRTALVTGSTNGIGTAIASAAAEFGGAGVRGNTVSPGVTRAAGEHDLAVAGLTGSTPAGRAGTPQEVAQAVGWGRVCPDSAQCPAKPRTLRQLSAEIVPRSQCSDTKGEDDLCTGFPVGTGACHGDSGGPQLVATGSGWRLVGVTSREGQGRTRCGAGPTIHTSVRAHASWLAEVMASPRP